jgi:NAD(P)-dependent dehydrogenase (short-subunit alcohol dehydrogenase family)
MTRPVAFVTGAGRGVGHAIALRLSRDGYAVAVAGRSEPPLRETMAAIEALSGEAVALTCDVRNRAGVDAAVARTEASLGHIDVLVNNAGIAESAPFVSMPDDMWDRVLAVNLTGAYNTMRRVAPGMFERRKGSIINIASSAGKVGYPYTAAYVASKHGLIGLTRAVALEAGRYGVRVNAICPGWVDTEMTDASIARIVERPGRSAAEARHMLTTMNPSGRLIAPSEIADLCAHLLSAASADLNGEAIDIQ